MGVELGALVCEACQLLVVCGGLGDLGGWCELCRTVPAPRLGGFLGQMGALSLQAAGG